MPSFQKLKSEIVALLFLDSQLRIQAYDISIYLPWFVFEICFAIENRVS